MSVCVRSRPPPRSAMLPAYRCLYPVGTNLRLSRLAYRKDTKMAIYKLLYLPVLMSCCIVTVGYWLPRLGGGGIDLGPPNARS